VITLDSVPKLIFCVVLLLSVFSNAAETSAWKMHIKGAKFFSENFLKEQLDLPEEMDVISPERRSFIIKLARGNLHEFYQSNGYFSADVSLSISQETIDSAKVEVYTFNVYEGEKYSFGYANIVFAEGSSAFLIDVDKLSVSKGGAYDSEIISNDRKNIREVYLKDGYLHITVEHLEYIDTVEKKVNVHYFTDPKHQVRMGNFSSRTFRSGLLPGQTEPEAGLSDTAWLNKLWEIEHDSIVNEKYYYSFRTKLFSTQLFSQVKLEDSLQENGLSDITLTVYERVPGEANYRFFFEQIYGFGVSFSSLHRNLFGSLHEMGLGTVLAENRQELSLNYAHPLLFGTGVSWIPTAIRLDERISLSHEQLPAPTDPDSIVERWEVLNRANLSFGLSSANPNRIRNRHTFDLKYLKLEGEDYFKLKYETGLVFDYTDNSFNPIKGFRLTPSFGVGGELQHESFSKVKNVKKLAEIWNISMEHVFLYTETSAYIYTPIYPFKRYLLSAFAFSYGNVFYNKASEDDAQVFYQGGGRTLRGYRFRSVFPYKINSEDATASLEAGRSPQYYRINEELRVIPPWRPLRSFQVVQFTDWVHIDDRDKSFYSSEEMSLGMGLRYKWQFLTFRLDYAMKTQFKDFKLDKFQFSHIVFDLSQAI